MRRKKMWGRIILLAAVGVLVAGDFVPGVVSLFMTLGAMLLGFVGMLLAFADSE